MATSTWNTFANSTTASAVDVNANFDALTGDIVPMDASGTFTTDTFNLGTSTNVWATVHATTVKATTVSSTNAGFGTASATNLGASVLSATNAVINSLSVSNPIHSNQDLTPFFMEASTSGNSGSFVTIVEGYLHIPDPNDCAIELFVGGSTSGGGTWSGQLSIAEFGATTGNWGDTKTLAFVSSSTIANPVAFSTEVDLSSMSLDGTTHDWYRVRIQVLRDSPAVWAAQAGAALVHN